MNPLHFTCVTFTVQTLFIGIYKEPLTSSDLSIQGSLDYSNVLHTNFFKNHSKKGSLGNHRWFFYGIAMKTPLFLRVKVNPQLKSKQFYTSIKSEVLLI